ncbi:hypothetical protein SteCoe_6547 [Stentor coeruleus]|uniref:Uncharacterized protein n=1 Tax=Stentor coeruleus TaxID=5963 RepID=A0A1R2CPP7_9CILI|nr:hypothetical protein SteCoe_6547 [Stentor coeruleus]
MDKSCGVPDCPRIAILKCNCKEQYKFCKSDMKKHSAVAGCYYKSCDEAPVMLEIKDKENAFDNLSSEIIQLANNMIIEIKDSLEENLVYIQKKKNQANNENEQVDNLVSWAKSFKLLNRNKSDFIISIKNLLSINQNSSNEFIDTEKPKNKIEVEEMQKSLEQANSKNEVLENEITKCNKTIKNMQEKIKLYENYLESKQSSLDQANTRIRKLESDIAAEKAKENDEQNQCKLYAGNF